MRRSRDMDGLQAKLGINISRRLLERALTHGSVNQTGGPTVESHRKLAFLGDAVIELAIRERMYRELEGASLGAVSIEADKIVRNAKLAECARTIALGDFVDLGPGAEKERNADSVLANAVEGVLGAVFYEQGFKPAADCALRLLQPAADVRAQAT